MTIQQVRHFLDACPGLYRNDGDIDDYWENDDVEIMLTHTRWCKGENNNEHELLVFEKLPDGDISDPICLFSFTEVITGE